jgi:hypothetical protein
MKNTANVNLQRKRLPRMTITAKTFTANNNYRKTFFFFHPKKKKKKKKTDKAVTLCLLAGRQLDKHENILFLVLEKKNLFNLKIVSQI